MTVEVSDEFLLISIIISSILLILILILSVYIIRKLLILNNKKEIKIYFVYATVTTLISSILSSMFLLSFTISEFYDPYDWYLIRDVLSIHILICIFKNILLHSGIFMVNVGNVIHRLYYGELQHFCGH